MSITSITSRKPRKLSLIRDKRGLSTVEYAIILCLIAVVGFAVWQTFGNTIKAKVGGADTTMGGLPTSSSASGGGS